MTAKDVELAARENFISVEHLKRYTTLGMANDQGKTSNMNGLALMAASPAVRSRKPAPPPTGHPLRRCRCRSFAGSRSGPLFNPVRRLQLEHQHRADGAVFLEYGGWLRPAYFGSGTPEERKSAARFWPRGNRWRSSMDPRSARSR